MVRRGLGGLVLRGLGGLVLRGLLRFLLLGSSLLLRTLLDGFVGFRDRDVPGQKLSFEFLGTSGEYRVGSKGYRRRGKAGSLGSQRLSIVGRDLVVIVQ